MKIIRPIEDFGKIQEASTPINEATPIKVQFRYDLSDNLNKAAKIQKTLIDLQSLLTGMDDEIVSFKSTYPNLDEKSEKLFKFMRGNIADMVKYIKANGDTGMNDLIIKLKKNLEALKKRNIGQ